MNPRIGKRSRYNETARQPESKAVEFIVRNTKKSLTLKQEYLYLEDVKTALNIHHLEQHILVKRWMIGLLGAGVDPKKIIEVLEDSLEQKRHRLQKNYKISV